MSTTRSGQRSHNNIPPWNTVPRLTDGTFVNTNVQTVHMIIDSARTSNKMVLSVLDQSYKILNHLLIGQNQGHVVHKRR